EKIARFLTVTAILPTGGILAGCTSRPPARIPLDKPLSFYFCELSMKHSFLCCPRSFTLAIVACLAGLLSTTASQAQDMNHQACHFSTDGQSTTVAMCSKYIYMAFGLKSGGVAIYPVKEHKPVYANAWMGHEKPVTCQIFSPDDKQVATGAM